MRITDWMITAIEAHMKTKLTTIAIPDDIKFSDLRLARDPDGSMSFDFDVIERICEASNIPVDLFRDAPEDNVANLIVRWYDIHRARGGASDPVADDLITDEVLEVLSGRAINHPSGIA